MSEAPEKMWFDTLCQTARISQVDEWDVQYIRADLVDELVEALEYIKDYELNDRYITAIARTALAKVRGEKNG